MNVTVSSSFKLGNLTAMMESDTSSTDHSELLELEENVPNIVLGDNTKQIFTELLELKKYEDGYQVSKKITEIPNCTMDIYKI